jgi:hypothetical protein
MRVLLLTCYGVDIPTASVDFSLIATFDNNYPLSRKYTRRVMLGYQGWELFKADLDLDLEVWKAWMGPNLAAGKALAATTTTATGVTGVSGGLMR